ncbi:rare lipoprotein A [compost metagenome]
MSTKSNTVVNLVLFFFVSLLSFSIGTFVGKKFSDNQHQLAALEPSKAVTKTEREIASISTGDSSEKIGTAMTDEEIAKLAEEFVADDEGTVATGLPTEGQGETAEHESAADVAHGKVADTHKPETTVKPGTMPTKSEPSTMAQNLASGKNPNPTTANQAVGATTAKENRIPSSLPKDVAQFAVGKFTVQVAAYSDEGEAQRMASDLKTKGYSAFYVPANVKGKTWYRVSVGQFATQKEAQSYKGELLNKAKVSTAIVQKITE